MKPQVEPPRFKRNIRLFALFTVIMLAVGLSAKLAVNAASEPSLIDEIKTVTASQFEVTSSRQLWWDKGNGWSSHHSMFGLGVDDTHVIQWRLHPGWVNDFNPTALHQARWLWLTPDPGGTRMTDLWAADGSEGRIIHIANAGPGGLELWDENVYSMAKNRFHLDGSDVLYVSRHSLLTVIYDGVLRRWRVWPMDGCHYHDICFNWFGERVTCSPSRACPTD